MLAAGMALALLTSLATPADAARRTFKDVAAANSKGRDAAIEAPFGDMPKGPLQLVVSLRKQNVTLYSNGHRVARAPVSTGTADRPTPTGVFSVIQKDRWHRSNLYDNAPMYFMHRLTWSGVAMHEGYLPGVPASHGCIRLPRAFAARLWAVSKLGARVVVARDEVVPQDFAHPQLFVRKEKPAEVAAVADLRFDGLRPSLSEMGIAPGPPIKLVSAAVDGPVKPALDAAEPPNPAPLKKAAAPPKRGQVAVFVSRTERKIFVRQGFAPLFDLPIEIVNPDQPLGTHLFTALELKADGSHMRWNAITLSSGPDTADRAPNTKRAGKTAYPAVQPTPTATQALERIRFPQEALDRIGELLVPGSSLIVSDSGLGTETGRFTEFIVVTR